MKIHHDQEAKRFYIVFDSGEKAELKYRLQEDNGIDFYSTFVPNTERGKGLAAKLVQHGFAWAKEQGLTIYASCWYAREFI